MYTRVSGEVGNFSSTLKCCYTYKNGCICLKDNSLYEVVYTFKPMLLWTSTHKDETKQNTFT